VIAKRQIYSEFCTVNIQLLQPMTNQFIICDPQDITRLGFRELICSFFADAIINEAYNKEELMQQLELKDIGVVLIDFELFDIDQLKEIGLIHQQYPNSKWLFTSGDIHPEFLYQLVSTLPFSNFVLKTDSQDDVTTALSFTRQGKRYYCSTALDVILYPLPQLKKQEIEVIPSLTPTEKEIVQLLVAGKSTKEIADTRCLSYHTVGTHRKNIFRKMKVTNIQDLVKSAIKCGMVDFTEYYI
jgi:DNA-binding NarL/FixJ family response regulator